MSWNCSVSRYMYAMTSHFPKKRHVMLCMTRGGSLCAWILNFAISHCLACFSCGFPWDQVSPFGPAPASIAEEQLRAEQGPQ